MNISIVRRDEEVTLDLTPESQADMFLLEALKVSCSDAHIAYEEVRQWNIQELRLVLVSDVAE